ncbi:MAG TPA: GNAT family N-acetyltransferase [Candidatus Angelobacter sp.]
MDTETAPQDVVFETERLLLRPHVIGDADALEAVLGDPVAMEFYPAVLDRRGVEEWITRNVERYQRDGFGKWAMVVKSTGEMGGSVGCVLQEVEGRNEIEVGYNVRRDLWGNGYATEAARACMDYAFGKLGVKRVISMIRPENVRSIRVAAKNEMIREKVIFWRGYDHCIYAKMRTDHDSQT